VLAILICKFVVNNLNLNKMKKDIISGKKVKAIVSKYGSREGTDMVEFAEEEIKDDDEYTLENVLISDLLKRDINLQDFVKDELENYKKGNKITEPILLGDEPYNSEKNVVRDGFGRTTQAIANGDKTILAFVKNPTKLKEGGSIGSKGTFKSLGSAKELGITTKVEGHDMIAICDCGEKFSYQNSKKSIVWGCPECKGMKRLQTS